VAYVKDTSPHLAKMDARGKKVVFIGYETRSKAYHVFDPVENRALVSRDIVFYENPYEIGRTMSRRSKLEIRSRWCTWSLGQEKKL
jgi:hypothetical protein